jgi:hypothetical protein
VVATAAAWPGRLAAFSVSDRFTSFHRIGGPVRNSLLKPQDSLCRGTKIARAPTNIQGEMSMITMRATGLFPLLLAAALAAPGVAQASDVQVQLLTRNSPTNPGPFSSGENATFDASFRIDGSVAPTGGTPTWNGALDDLTLAVTDSLLGSFTIQAQNGRLQQLSGGGTDFMTGGWGGIYGGEIAPFSLAGSNSAAPYVLQFITFDFRGPQLFSNPQTLPGALSHAPSPAETDFSFLDLSLHFSNADPLVSVVDKVSIIRAPAFVSVSVSPVPEPAALSMLVAGLLTMGALVRRRLR